MKIYLVGGAVRDELLGIPVKDRDFVVTGSTINEMLDKGYAQVGKGFPVFLHPQTKEEYALARKERKIALGHDGFAFEFTPQTTLEEDLERRDLTINAIAKSNSGELIDPYHGEDDLAQKKLRHVSEAFKEDPLRVLRVCRFKAKLPEFTIAQETFELMQGMIHSNDFAALSKHRLWQELLKSLDYEKPELFFEVLHELGYFPRSLRAKISTHNHQHPDPIVKFACLFKDSALLTWIQDVFHPPKDFVFLAKVIQQHTSLIQGNYNGEAILSCLKGLKAFSNEKWLPIFAKCAAIQGNDALGDILNRAIKAAKNISARSPQIKATGPELGAAIEQARIESINQLLASL